MKNIISRYVRQPIKQLVERDRIVANPHAGRVVDRISDRSRASADAKFTDPLGLHRRRARVHFVEEDHFLMRNVRMNRHLIAGEVMIDEEAVPLVDRDAPR